MPTDPPVRPASEVYALPNDSAVAVGDLFDPLPDFVCRADCLFVDVPYNQALLTNFINRPGARLSPRNTRCFPDFLVRLGEAVAEIAPAHAFIEVGKEALADVVHLLRPRYRYVTFYNATYYRRPENKCYVVHGTDDYARRRYAELEDRDEAEIVAWLCANHPFRCIGDLCMGEGLVGRHAYLNGRPFVGIEINPERLGKLVAFVEEREAAKPRPLAPPSSP